MNWLNSLPHQIPFRAASAATKIDDKTIEGLFLCTANDETNSGLMAIEAMAQLAGGLAFHQQAGPGFLTGIDRCELDREVMPGDRIVFRVTLDAAFGGTFRFRGQGSIDGLEVIRGRFYLARPGGEES